MIDLIFIRRFYEWIGGINEKHLTILVFDFRGLKIPGDFTFLKKIYEKI